MTTNHYSGGSPGRLVALRTLLALEGDSEALASETLNYHRMQLDLSSDDGRFARTLVFGVLRRALTLDFLYGRFLKKRQAVSGALRAVLRLGAYQRYFMDRIPSHAMVNDSIQAARVEINLSAREVGFLNAVLRKVAADEGDWLSDLPQGNRMSALSVRYSFPVELVSILVGKFGGQVASEIMELANLEPPMTIRTNLLRISREALGERLLSEGFSAVPGLLAPEALVVERRDGGEGKGGSLFETAVFQEGLFYAQDEGSQMVAHIARAALGAGAILDLCAAPGGKTTHLAELTGGEREIVATDASDRRLELVEQNVARLQTPGISIMRMAEVLSRVENGGRFALVLVDAPCSGLGTVRRNPEIRYRLSLEGLMRHQERQLEVLRVAAGCVRPGGAIVYSTCSVSDQENEHVITRFLKENAGWKRERVETGRSDLLSRIGSRKSEFVYATWPGLVAVDGFEATVLRYSG